MEWQKRHSPDGRGGLRIKGGRGQGMQGWRQSKKLVTSARHMKDAEKEQSLQEKCNYKASDGNSVTDNTDAHIQRSNNSDHE